MHLKMIVFIYIAIKMANEKQLQLGSMQAHKLIAEIPKKTRK